ncbi:MAG: polysaccharide deacetylase family protein [Candidatus Riflebacteria bacterium]
MKPGLVGKIKRCLLLLTFLLVGSLVCASQLDRIAQYLRANPNNPDLLNSYGIELANAGNLTEAIRIWRRALDFSPRNIHLYNNIGSALKRLGHDQHAWQWYAAALAIQPTYWTYYNLAIIYRDRNQTNEAIWSLKKSLELNRDFLQAKDLLRRIESGLMPEIADQGIKTPVALPDKKPSAIVTAPPEKNKHLYEKTIKEAKSQIVREPEAVKTEDYPAEKIVRLPDDRGGQVFLTFDGGADDDGFTTIVDILDEFKVKCTFFLTGGFVRNYPEKARQILARGHEIANHSMSHPDMKNFSAEKIAAEINAAEDVFAQVTGQRGAPFFRFPFGHQNQRVEKIVETLGYRPVYWHIDTIDWREDPVNTIISRVDKKLRRGSVILMHIGSKNGAKALRRILEIISSRGYNPVRLSDLDPSLLVSLPSIHSH